MNQNELRQASSTREQLLLTAERLFATQGIESVSLRLIAREGGQKNVGAMQYHFGDRQGLFEAILEYRMSGLNALRKQMLDELVASGADDDLRALVHCLVSPYVEHVREEGLSSYYVEFLARFQVTFPHYLPEIFNQKPWQRSMVELAGHMEKLLADLPQYLLRQRLHFMGTNMIQSVGEFERNIRSQKSRMEELDVFTENLVDALCGLLSAPVSAKTQALMADIQP